jgi:WXXGXW repeat (2 copies)
MSVNGKLRMLFAVALLAGAPTGCAVYARPGGFVYVQREPPVARVEVIPASPGAEFVWTPGYWSWGGSEHVWVSGRWVVPPAGHRVWVAHRWEHDSHGWHLIEGHWR